MTVGQSEQDEEYGKECSLAIAPTTCQKSLFVRFLHARLATGNLLLDLLLASSRLADGFGEPGHEPKVAYSDVEPDQSENREDRLEAHQNRVSQVDARGRQTEE